MVSSVSAANTVAGTMPTSMVRDKSTENSLMPIVLFIKIIPFHKAEMDRVPLHSPFPGSAEA